MFARVAAVSPIRMRFFVHPGWIAALEQGDLVKGSEPGTAGAGNLTQVHNEIARRVILYLLRLIHDPYKV